MAAVAMKRLKKLYSRMLIKKGNGAKSGDGYDGLIPNRIQKLVSLGEYNGLSPLVRAEGAFVQYNADGSYYRRVGLGVTHTELLMVTQTMDSSEDENEEDLKIDVMFPLPAVLFILLDKRAKRFAVCTGVGILMFFEMCIDEPCCEENWSKWRRVIFLQAGETSHGLPQWETPTWQPNWTSPYVINLSEQNDLQTYEFLAKMKGKIHRTLYFTQQPFTIRLVRHIGVQTSKRTGAYIERLKQNRIGSPTSGGHVESRVKIESRALPGQPESFSQNATCKTANCADSLTAIGSPRESLKTSVKTYLRKFNHSKDEKNRTLPGQRLCFFYGGVRLIKSFEEISAGTAIRKHARPTRRSYSCSDLTLSDRGRKITRLDRIIGCSWNSNVFSSTLTAGDQILARKYSRFTKKIQEQSGKRPFEMSSPTIDVDDIDDLVEEFSEKRRSGGRRSGRDLWMIARKKLFYRAQAFDLDQLQKIVSTYVFKVSPHRYKKKVRNVMELTPLIIALELFTVSRKLLLSITGSDIVTFQNSNGKQEIKTFSKILEFSNALTKMVVAQILDCKELVDRVDALKFFVEVCQHLLINHHDFQSFIAIMRALTSLPIYRLRNTWSTFHVEYPLQFSNFVCFGKVTSPARGYASYRSRIEVAITNDEPYILWLEHFMAHCKRQTDFLSENKIELKVKKAKTKKSTIKKKEKDSSAKEKPSVKKTDMTNLKVTVQQDSGSEGKPSGTKKDTPQLKPILQEPKTFVDPDKLQKNVRFYSKVDVVESRSSAFDKFRTSKVPLGAKIVEPKYSDEELEAIENFSDKTAANVMDRAMKDVKELQLVSGKRRLKKKKPSYKEASGLYLKLKIPEDDDELGKEKLITSRNQVAAESHIPGVKTKTNAQKQQKQDKEEDLNIRNEEKTDFNKPLKEENKKYGTRDQPELADILPDMPTRKRKMSVMEMKKQNRRMSLFEQAAIKRDRRKDNAMESVINKRLQEMRNKGSVAVDLLEFESQKRASVNNNFPDSYQNGDTILTNLKNSNKQKHLKSNNVNEFIPYRSVPKEELFAENYHLHNSRDIETLPCTDVGDHIKLNSLKMQKNNSNKTKINNGSDKTTKKEASLVNPCKTWSGTLLDVRAFLSRDTCGLCGKKRCVYTDGLRDSLIQQQLNILKCDVHSSEIASDCLSVSTFTSSLLSDTGLLKISLNLEA